MGQLALTFDDGPDPTWTPRLLDVLADAGARATFFVIARRAAACPKIIARAQQEGHAIQLHCDQHVRHCDRTARWVARDTAGALDTLAAIGVAPTLWRTPWGVVQPWSHQIARRHGLRLTDWDVDTHDWRGDQAIAIFEATRDALRDMAVVLAHDAVGPGARRANPAQTIDYTRLVIGEAAARGLVLGAMR